MKEKSNINEVLKRCSNQRLINLYNQILRQREWTPNKSDLIVSMEKELERRYVRGIPLTKKGKTLNVYTDYRNTLLEDRDEVFLVGEQIHSASMLDKPKALLKFQLPKAGGAFFGRVSFKRIKTNTINLSDYLPKSKTPILLNFEHDLPQTIINTAGVKGYVLCKFRHRLNLMGIDYLKDQNNGFFTIHTRSKIIILFPKESFKPLIGKMGWFEFVFDYKDNRYLYN